MTTEPLSRSSAALPPVDHQTRVLEWVVKVPLRDQVATNVLRLARAAAALDLPVIFATNEEGENGHAAAGAGAADAHRLPKAASNGMG
jgi:nicotinamidase-related amidase